VQRPQRAIGGNTYINKVPILNGYSAAGSAKLHKMPFFDFESHKLHYSVSGAETSPSVFLVHGFIVASRVFDSLVAALTPNYRVISMDFLGHGESARPDTSPLYTADGFHKSIHALLQHLSISKTVLMGWSMGSKLAFEFARKYPDLISSLVLIGTTPMMVAPDDTTEFPALPHSAALALLENIRTSYSTFYEPFVLGCLPEYTPGTIPVPTYVQNALEDGKKLNGRIASEIFYNMAVDGDVRSTVGEINTRSLLICGTKDQLTPVAASEWMVEHLGGEAKLVLFEDVGHTPFVGPSGEKCIGEILKFIEMDRSEAS